MAKLTSKHIQEPSALPKISWKLIFVALVFLFNPNINVIDPLPDFIGYFILASLLKYPADISPYFEETRATFLKLAWLNVLKIPAIAVVLGSGVGRGDTTALLALGFGVGDLILGIMAVRYLFEALFYLGERTDADEIITPFALSKRRTLTPEAYCSFTMLFVCVKSAIAIFPEFLLLTENTAGDVYTATNLALYPITVVLSQLLGLAVGSVWLYRSVRYAKALLKDNALERALSSIFCGDLDKRFEEKFRLRALFASFTIAIFSSFLAFCIRFDNLGGAPLIPTVLFPLAFSYAIFVSRRHLKGVRTMLTLGLSCAVLSAAESVCSHLFFSEYTLEDIYYFDKARTLYLPVEIFCVISSLLLIAFLAVSAKSYRTLILEGTGISPESESYRKVDRDYHALLCRRLYLFFGLGILLAVAKAADVLLYGMPKLIFTNPSDVTMPTIISPSLPWFSSAVTALSVIFILSAFYFFSTLKDEIAMKQENM